MTATVGPAGAIISHHCLGFHVLNAMSRTSCRLLKAGAGASTYTAASTAEDTASLQVPQFCKARQPLGSIIVLAWTQQLCLTMYFS